MKIKKMLAFLSAGVMTASFLSTAASAENIAQAFAAKENVRVLYDAPLNGVEFGTFELGKSIEGAKLRFTYVSDSEEGTTTTINCLFPLNMKKIFHNIEGTDILFCQCLW